MVDVCKGGSMVKSFKYKINHGVVLAKNYPYHSHSGTCQLKVGMKIKGIKNIGCIQKREDVLKNTVAYYGPVTCAIVQSMLHHLTSNFINEESCMIQYVKNLLEHML